MQNVLGETITSTGMHERQGQGKTEQGWAAVPTSQSWDWG